MKNNKFWSGKKVLITGGSGFIGSHLIKILLNKRAKLYTFSNQKIIKNIILEPKEIQKINKEIVGNISDKKLVFKTFSDIKPDICFHLAAQPLVEMGEEKPELTFETNVIGTVYILEAARINGTKSIILASTSHVYGHNKTPLLEKYFPQPSRPYETSKACADIIAQTYATYYHLPVYIARFTNIYGPGDMNKRLVPRTISLLQENKPPVVYNDRVARDFIFIDDAIDAYLTLAQAAENLKNKPENIVYNFGSGQKYRTGQIVDLIKKIMHKTHIKTDKKKDLRSDEILDQTLSVSKAKKNLKWSAKVDLKSGLDQTIAWYVDKI